MHSKLDELDSQLQLSIATQSTDRSYVLFVEMENLRSKLSSTYDSLVHTLNAHLAFFVLITRHHEMLWVSVSISLVTL